MEEAGTNEGTFGAVNANASTEMEMAAGEERLARADADGSSW